MKYHVTYIDHATPTINNLDDSNICQEYFFAKSEAEVTAKFNLRNTTIQRIRQLPPEPESLRGAIEEDELEIVLDCLNREAVRAKSIHNRPIQGYGGAGEETKKEAWRRKADQIKLIINKLSEAYI
jgi:hypothetical protein